MLKIKHKYGGLKGDVIQDILKKADKNTAWSSFLLNNYDSYLETLNIFNTKEVTRFKKLCSSDTPSHQDYQDVITDHELTSEQIDSLDYHDYAIGYWYTDKETDAEKNRRIHNYKVENFTQYVHYVMHSITLGNGADSYVGGTQFQLNKHIEKTFAEEDFVACVCLLNEYIRRRYGIEHIEYIDE